MGQKIVCDVKGCGTEVSAEGPFGHFGRLPTGWRTITWEESLGAAADDPPAPRLGYIDQYPYSMAVCEKHPLPDPSPDFLKEQESYKIGLHKQRMAMQKFAGDYQGVGQGPILQQRPLKR